MLKAQFEALVLRCWWQYLLLSLPIQEKFCQDLAGRDTPEHFKEELGGGDGSLCFNEQKVALGMVKGYFPDVSTENLNSLT